MPPPSRLCPALRALALVLLPCLAAAEPAVRPVGPATLDRPGLDSFFDRSAPRFGASSTAAPAPPAPGRLRFRDADLPRVQFASQGSIAAELVKAIDATEASLRLVLYDFNLQPVLEALQRASQKKPPVQIQVVLDESHVFPGQGKQPTPQIQALLKDASIQTRIIRGFDAYGTMHNKFALFDDRMVKYGSFNWTNAAETRHHENAVFSMDAARVGRYQDYWAWVWANARPADGPHGPPTLTPGPPKDKAPSIRFKTKLFPVAVFSPRGGTAQWLTEAIHRSERTIDVAMFSFFHQGLADALLERKNKGVRVRLVLDKNQARNSPVVPFLKEHGFDLRIIAGRPDSPGFGVMHNKYAVFDGELVETGSYNWTNNAEHNNFENINFLNDPSDVAAFQADLERLHEQAEKTEATASLR